MITVTWRIPKLFPARSFNRFGYQFALFSPSLNKLAYCLISIPPRTSSKYNSITHVSTWVLWATYCPGEAVITSGLLTKSDKLSLTKVERFQLRIYPGVLEGRAPPHLASKLMFFGHIFTKFNFNCTNKLFCHNLNCIWLFEKISNWTWFLYSVIYGIFDNDKSGQHFTSFRTEAECIIKRPRFKRFLSSSNFRKHRISTVIMRHLAYIVLRLYQQFQLRCNTTRKQQLASLI